MTRRELLDAIGDVVSLPAGTLQGDETLSAITGWDSLSGVAFRVAVEKRWKVPVSGIALSRCDTVADVIGLFDSRVTDR
jgi:acyl carrier protein